MKLDAPVTFPIGVWLVPASPHYEALAAMISNLAHELSAPRFEPHLTLYAGACGNAHDAEVLLTRAAQGADPIDLLVTAVGTTPELFKTLYLQFEPAPQAERLSQFFRASLPASASYVLNPHLSLLYKHLPAPTRDALAQRVPLVGQRITFDQIAVVRPGDRRDDWLDIERWDVWLRKPLGAVSSPGRTP